MQRKMFPNAALLTPKMIRNKQGDKQEQHEGKKEKFIIDCFYNMVYRRV